jgi:3-oxoacyl-[acyl-carrier-protein] synthase III
MPRKFVKQTGFCKRSVSTEDEVALAVHASENLIRESGCDMRNCAGVIFTSPSFVPMHFAHQYLSAQKARNEQLNRAADRYVKRMNIQPRRVAATNTFCAGFAKALSIIKYKFGPSIGLQPDEFILVLTSSCISRITDYSCQHTAGLFGDMATATIVSRSDSKKYPIQFELLDAIVEKKPTNRPFFDFACRHQVLCPAHNGGKRFDDERVVFTLDGMGIADSASRAMAIAACEMLDVAGFRPENVQYVVPHQAGLAIVRLTEMKLREAGFTCEVVNGLTSEIGNASSGSIPFALSKKWQRLDGNILCPVGSVGPPGKSVVFQGCIALRSMIHRE